ncbi:MAG: type IX secretion system membrane protein PorP/SprF [Chitinophagales bacterium]
MNIRSKLIVTLIISLLFFLAGTTPLRAQQDAEYSMYMFNGLYLNPAYAGAKEAPTIMAIYRHQWSGLEGAPRSFNVSGHSPFKRDQYALGGTLHYDQIGAEKKYKADFDFAFRIPIKNQENKISFGIRAGVMYYTVKPENYQPDYGLGYDPTLEASYKTIIPNFGFGVHASGKRYYVGVGLPHLINLSLKEHARTILNDEEAKQFKHVFATAGVVLGKEYGKVKVKPSVLYKWSQSSPMDFDINLSLLFIDRVWVGASWRTGGDYENRKGESVIGIVKFKATQQLEIGYAYDHTLSRISQFNNGSHEIMLGFEFGGKGKQFVTPRYIRYF